MDQSSFASILAGVKQMRQDYEVQLPERPKPARDDATGENNQNDKSGDKSSDKFSDKSSDKSGDQSSGKSEPSAPAASAAHRTVQNSTTAPVTPATAPARATPDPVLQARAGARNDPVHSYTAVQVAPSQKGNPLLESTQMKATPWTYNGQILSDYYINATVQILFLSLKYHKLRPEYVWRRLEKLRGGAHSDGSDGVLRVLLVVVDIDSPQEVIRKLSVVCIKNDLTMVVAWSFEEAGTYVASLKANESARTKVHSAIQGVKKGDYNTTVLNSLTTVRAVNKTDVANLLANCRSFKNIVLQATQGDGLAGISGLGDRKVENLASAFGEPFIFNKQ